MILENLKTEEIKQKEKIMKINIINGYSKIYRTDKDPLYLAEDIAMKMYSFLAKNSLNKFKPEMITPKFLGELCSSKAFSEIKECVAELQVTN